VNWHPSLKLSQQISGVIFYDCNTGTQCLP
jgi:hypothetical protein